MPKRRNTIAINNRTLGKDSTAIIKAKLTHGKSQVLPMKNYSIADAQINPDDRYVTIEKTADKNKKESKKMHCYLDIDSHFILEEMMGDNEDKENVSLNNNLS
jgi:hypothetical protein